MRVADPPPVLVLTTFDDDETLAAALGAGAAGFLLKDAPGEDIVRAVRTVAAGGSLARPAGHRPGAGHLPSDVAAAGGGAGDGRPAHRAGARGPGPVAPGARTPRSPPTLVIGEGTVKTHVGHVLTKLGLRDRAAAIVFAFDHGLVTPGG